MLHASSPRAMKTDRQQHHPNAYRDSKSFGGGYGTATSIARLGGRWLEIVEKFDRLFLKRRLLQCLPRAT